MRKPMQKGKGGGGGGGVYGASISAATVVSAAAAAAVMVPIREGKARKGTPSIFIEGDIDVGGESTEYGEDHVPRNRCSAYCDDRLQSNGGNV